MIQAPIKATPVVVEDCRDITEGERIYYKVLSDHYRERCLANPCDRGLRSYWRNILGILESGKIGTSGTVLGPGTPDPI